MHDDVLEELHQVTVQAKEASFATGSRVLPPHLEANFRDAGQLDCNLERIWEALHSAEASLRFTMVMLTRFTTNREIRRKLADHIKGLPEPEDVLNGFAFGVDGFVWLHDDMRPDSLEEDFNNNVNSRVSEAITTGACQANDPRHWVLTTLTQVYGVDDGQQLVWGNRVPERNQFNMTRYYAHILRPILGSVRTVKT